MNKREIMADNFKAAKSFENIAKILLGDTIKTEIHMVCGPRRSTEFKVVIIDVDKK